MKHNLLKSVIISVILLMGVSNAWAWTISSAKIYYDDSNSKWGSNVVVAFDKNDGGAVFAMTKINNTSLHYWTGSWGDNQVSYMRFGKTTQTHNWYAWGDYAKSTWDLSTHDSWDGVSNGWGIHINNEYKMFGAESNSSGADLTKTDLSGYLSLNYNQTVQQHLSTNGSAYAASTASIATVKVSSYKLNNATTTAADSKTIASSQSSATCSAAHTATVTYTVSGVNTGYKFVGWYDGNTQKSTNTTYTYPATGAKTITARFEKTYAVTISEGANGTVSPSGSQQVGSTNVTITATANTGYKFKNWTKMGGVVIANANNATTTITATATGTVTANFEEDLSSNWKLIGDNQTNSPFGDNYTYSNGKAMTKKSGHSTESNVYITLDIKHLPASYYGFKVATSNNDNDKYGYGQGAGDYIEFNRSASNSQKQVYSGSQHELKFIPDALGEYEFRVNYPSNKYVYVTFPTAYAVTFGKGTGGSSVTAKYNSTSFNSGTKVQQGKTVTFTQIASAGYTFKEWNTKSDGTGTKLSTNATYTRTVAATNTVYAIYTKNPDNIVYLKPSHSWKSNNAQFAVKYGGTNYKMTEVEECREEKYYKVTIPSEYSKFNFVRLSDDGTTEWNVTGEISVPTDGKNLYDMTKIYLKPNANWKSGNARFAAYFFDSQDNLNKNKWMSMLPTDEDGVFYCDFPTDHIFDNVSLTRMNGAESYNDWAYRWNQTKDIDLFQGYNSYELEEGKWGKDNSNPQTDDNMDVSYKCKWTTYNPTYSVTLEPFQYGQYGVNINGKTYYSKPSEQVVIENVALGTQVKVIDAVSNTHHYGPKLNPETGEPWYDCSVVVQKNSTVTNKSSVDKVNGELQHTLCGHTTFLPNMVTTAPHRVYLHIPENLTTSWNNQGEYNYVWAREHLTNSNDGRPGALIQMTKETNLSDKGDGEYWYCDIPAGYNRFYFERKASENGNKLVGTKFLAYATPLNNINCYTLTSASGTECEGTWGVMPTSEGDYRLLYVEQVVEKDDWKTVINRTLQHPSDIVKPYTQDGTHTDIVSLHIYKDKTVNGETVNPEVILQKCTGASYNNGEWTYTWQDIEAHMVNGPLKADAGMAMINGRRNAGTNAECDDFVYDDGIEVIKNDQEEGRVWNFTIQQFKSPTTENDTATLLLDNEHLKPYEGKYYIRTNNTKGGWSNYMQLDNYMTFSQYAKDNSGFSHYYCKWINIDNGDGGTAHENVNFMVANDYATDLAKECAQDDYTLGDGVLYEDANVRWSWDVVTNKISRAYIQGTWKANSQERNRNLVVNYKSSSSADDATDLLDDSGDWIYQKDFTVKVGSHLNSLTAQYPVSTGSTQTFASNLDMLTGDPETNKNDYKVRILYDFKINKTLVALVPENDKQADIAIDVIIERVDQGEATQVQAGINAARTQEGSTVYAVMSFTQDHIESSKTEWERLYYWVSFPFDVRISDVFGFGEYGVHWIMEYYDGAERAEKGCWADSPTYWRFITDTTYNSANEYNDLNHGLLHANQGYVLALTQDIADLGIFTNTEKVSLYFPSIEPISNINAGIIPTVVELAKYTCTIERNNRKIKDSNWHMLGVPSYANKTKTLTQDGLLYYYQYDATDNTYDVTYAKDEEVTFKSMHSYFVQFAGTIYWQEFSLVPEQLAARRYAASEPKEHSLRLELQQNGAKLDQTYVSLQEDGATTAFDMNLDLTKMLNAGTNVYTLIPTEGGDVEVAGNVLPVESAVVPLGVVAATAGEYTFAMPDGTDGIIVELIDYETNTRTNLLLSDYTVNLPAGTNDTRFALHVQPSKVTTSIENGAVEGESGKVRKLVIDGKLLLQKGNTLYDAQGHIVR